MVAPSRILLSLLPLLSSIVAAYNGDMTFFNPGLGSCGAYNTDSDYVVALHPSRMVDKRACGSQIRIWNQDGGREAFATVADTCMGCWTDQSIDVSPALFKVIAPNGDGRVHNIAWGGDVVGGKRMMKRREREVFVETFAMRHKD